MEFNHEEKNIALAIVGTEENTVEDMIREILENPAEMLGKQCSEYAEWVYDNVEDPNALTAMAVLIREGIVAMREKHGAPSSVDKEELESMLKMLTEMKAKLGA